MKYSLRVIEIVFLAACLLIAAPRPQGGGQVVIGGQGAPGSAGTLIQNATFGGLNGTLIKDTNVGQSLAFWSGAQGSTNPPQYVSLWLGGNITNPTSPNITFFCDMIDGGISFADCVLNAQGGMVTLRDRNVSTLDCGERAGNATTPGCIVYNTLQADVYISKGTQFGISGCSATAAIGGGTAGKFNSGTTGTCTVTITPPSNAAPPPDGWECTAHDITTPADVINQVTPLSTVTATLSGTTASGDVITFSCTGF